MPKPQPQPAHRERGMSTAEYTIGTLAAAAFAALLYVVLTSDEVQQVLLDMVTEALSIRG